MQGCKSVWLAGVLIAVVFCGGSAIAWSQESQPTYGPVDPVYSPTMDRNPVPTGLSAGTAGNRFASAVSFNADEPPADWTTWKAEVDEQLKKMADKTAAAKKKAAGKPSVKVGGRLFADWQAYTQNAASIGQIGNQQNGFRFDTVRIQVAGSAFHVVDYKVQFDFAGTQDALTKVSTTRSTFGGSVDPPGAVDTVTGTTSALQGTSFKDVFIAIKELPVLGHVKVGHFKEPFSLDQLTSSRFITFMERSLMDKPFVPGRRVGVMAYDYSENERATWAIGAFTSEIGDKPPIFRDDSAGTAATMRGTFLPWYDEATGGRGLFHLGVAYSYRAIADKALRMRSKPEDDLGSYIVNTGTFGLVDNEQLVGLEAAFVYGPFRIQSEYTKAFVKRLGGLGSPEFDGTYVQASYFLTGEQRKYKRTAGTFSDRVIPFENFFRVRAEDGNVYTGIGAWEVAYRCSYVDLNSVGVTGGNATDHTFGLNWYLNPYARLMFNYINSDLRRFGTTGNMSIFATRAQIDF